MTKTTHEFELLAPAGELNTFYSVIDAGADAVYFGGAAFGARAYAANFSYEDAEKAVLYAHLKGKKTYLTVNTLLKNTEIEGDLYDYIRSYHEMGIDAFLVQDFGVFNLIRDCFPKANIHMSTQCALASRYGASFFTKLGAKRIVLPRELSLAEMKSIHEATGASLEAFVHGAICICYSGDCLMSSLIGGRSGNRGRCAQPCRQPYDVYQDGKKIKAPGKFMLSPKELCGIEDIEGLYDAGIESLKIEGRMRSASYAAGVVGLYRKYIDIFLETGEGRPLSDKDKKKILDLGNRCGHTNAYYHTHNDSGMFSFESASMTSNIGENDIEAAPETFPVSMSFYAALGSPMSLTCSFSDTYVTVMADTPEVATGGGTSKENIIKQLKKTGQTLFFADDINIDLEEGLFIPMGAINKMRRDALSLLSDKLRRNALEGIEIKKKESVSPSGTGIPGLFLCICDTGKKADLALKYEHINAVGLTFSLAVSDSGPTLFERIHDSGRQAVLLLPPVIREEYRAVFEEKIEVILPKADKVIVPSFDGLAYLFEKEYNRSDIILAPRMYTYSDRAIEAFERLGITGCISPFELNKKELSHRYQKSTLQYIYGRVPLMYMAACVHKNTSGCDKRRTDISLKDRKGKYFPVKNECELCMNTIYNSLPMSLLDERDHFDKAGVSGFVIDLSGDDEKVSETVLKASEYPRGNGLPFETTKGHYNRGVE